MILKHDWFLRIVFLIRLQSDISGGAFELDVILNEHTIVKNRHGARRHHCPILGKARSAEKNVVALPLSRFAARVHERDVLLVNATSLAIRISAIVVRIQHLNFVAFLKKHSAVGSTLSVTFDSRRRAPFDVKLAIAENALRLDVAGGPYDGNGAFGDFPFRRAPVGMLPFGEIRSIEKHDCVRGRCRAYAWSHYARDWFPRLRELGISLRLLRLRPMYERRQ